MTEKHNILVTGGAGFIGTAVCYALNAAGYENVIAVDRKFHHSLPVTMWEEDYAEFFSTNDFAYDTIIHLAAEHNVPESIPSPEKYYTNNVVKMKAMLDHMVAIGIKNIIFSSTGNVYGRQGFSGPLLEDMYFDPLNPYAASKVAGETMIRDYAAAYGIRFVNFRYFNVAGADKASRFGYIQKPATNLVPVICQKFLKNEPIHIYGDNYTTPDGTCIRDYVHVLDVANAHLKALEYLDTDSPSETFNLGGGRPNGVSVKQMVEHAADTLEIDFPKIEYKPARIGDPGKLTADISKARYMLDWNPQYNIEDMFIHAWKWEKKNDEKFTR